MKVTYKLLSSTAYAQVLLSYHERVVHENQNKKAENPRLIDELNFSQLKVNELLQNFTAALPQGNAQPVEELLGQIAEYINNDDPIFLSIVNSYNFPFLLFKLIEDPFWMGNIELWKAFANLMYIADVDLINCFIERGILNYINKFISGSNEITSLAFNVLGNIINSSKDRYKDLIKIVISFDDLIRDEEFDDGFILTNALFLLHSVLYNFREIPKRVEFLELLVYGLEHCTNISIIYITGCLVSMLEIDDTILENIFNDYRSIFDSIHHCMLCSEVSIEAVYKILCFFTMFDKKLRALSMKHPNQIDTFRNMRLLLFKETFDEVTYKKVARFGNKTLLVMCTNLIRRSIIVNEKVTKEIQDFVLQKLKSFLESPYIKKVADLKLFFAVVQNSDQNFHRRLLQNNFSSILINGVSYDDQKIVIMTLQTIYNLIQEFENSIESATIKGLFQVGEFVEALEATDRFQNEHILFLKNSMNQIIFEPLNDE